MIPFHPLADLFPLMPEAERAAIAADMKANGFRAGEEIVLLDGMILDGRNRYLAAIDAGILSGDEKLGDNGCVYGEAREWGAFCLFSDEGGEGLFTTAEIEAGPLAFVISKNVHRRHLDESQRAMVAARIETLKQGERKDRKEGVDPATKSRDDDREGVGGENKPARDANLHVSRAEAAEMLNVSPRSVASAAVVRDQAEPEIQRAVEQGQLAVSAAAKAVVMAPEKQRAIAAAAAEGKTGTVNAEIKKAAREVREAELGAKITALPTHDGTGAKFGVILADPEWRFEVWSRASGLDRSADNHYPTSDAATIMARDVAAMAAEDCVLGLWVTDLARGIDTLRSWGFTFKSYFVWVKDIVEVDLTAEQRRAGNDADRHFVAIGPAGTGYWNTDRDELLLIGTRGDPVAPAPGTQGESTWFAARPRDAAGKIIHSAKPECCLAWFERHYPSTPKIELNRRGPARAGWSAWGNEVVEVEPAPAAAEPAPVEATRGWSAPADECPPTRTEEDDDKEEVAAGDFGMPSAVAVAGSLKNLRSMLA